MEVQYDACGRMNYHPEFHPNHGKPFTLDDLIYLCKYSETDGTKMMALAIGKTEMTVAGKLSHLKKTGQFEMYKNMPDELWERSSDSNLS